MRKWVLLIGVAIAAGSAWTSLAQAQAPRGQGFEQERPRRSAAEERRIAEAVIAQAIASGQDVAAAVEAAVEADPELARAFAQIARSNKQVAAAVNEGLRRAFAQLAQGGESGFPGGGNSSPYIPYMSSGGFGGGPVSPH